MVELRRKEVINIRDGCRLGFVGDVEVRVPEGQVSALIVFGPCRFFGLFGRGEAAGTTSSSATRPSRRRLRPPSAVAGGSAEGEKEGAGRMARPPFLCPDAPRFPRFPGLFPAFPCLFPGNVV